VALVTTLEKGAMLVGKIAIIGAGTVGTALGRVFLTLAPITDTSWKWPRRWLRSTLVSKEVPGKVA